LENITCSAGAGLCEGDIRDLYAFEDGAFDLVVCYGAPLSYVLGGREQAMRELKRVVRPGGTVAVGVNKPLGHPAGLAFKEFPGLFSTGPITGSSIRLSRRAICKA
jgi:SAM-dependent methyltransferase